MRNVLAIVLLVFAVSSVAFGVAVHQRQEAARLHGEAVAQCIRELRPTDTLASDHRAWLFEDAGWTEEDAARLDEWIRRARRGPDAASRDGADASAPGDEPEGEPLRTSLRRMADHFFEGRPDGAHEVLRQLGS